MIEDDEKLLFTTFKSLVQEKVDTFSIHWFRDHGVEVIAEVHAIAPTEIFVLGYRTWERVLGHKGEGLEHVKSVLAKAGLELEDSVVDFLVKIGDRVPISDDRGDFVYLFPRELYDKILLFNMVPD